MLIQEPWPLYSHCRTFRLYVRATVADFGGVFQVRLYSEPIPEVTTAGVCSVGLSSEDLRIKSIALCSDTHQNHNRPGQLSCQEI